MSLWRDMDEERDRREWEAQERAVRAKRLGARSGHRDLAENLTLPEPAAFRVQIVASWAAAIAACVGASAAFNPARKR